MSQFTGMNIEEVRSLATQMDSCAGSIQDLMSRLTNLLNSTQWVGPDREQFLGEWQGTHVTQLNSVINGLRDASNKARLNAQQQEAASNA
jgi:uncharacterized protein YukE